MRLLEFLSITESIQSDWEEKLNAKAAMNPEDVAYAKRYGNGDVLNVLQKADPTANNKFIRWLIKIYLSGTMLLEDAYKAKGYLELFIKFNSRIPGVGRDIQRYKSLNELYDVVKQFEEVQTQGDVDRALYQKMHMDPHAEVIYDDETMKVVIPKTQEASCYHGVNTKWCTAATSAHNMFSRYNDKGPLYYILDKPNNERVAFHFETGNFMNEADQPLDLMATVRAMPKLREIFGDKLDEAIIKKEPEAILELPNASDDIQNLAIELKPEMAGAIIENPTDKQRMAAIGINSSLFTKLATLDEEHRYQEMRDTVASAENAEEIKSGVGSIAFQYQHHGITPDIYMRIEDAFEDADSSIDGYSLRNKSFILQSWKSLNEFVNEELGEGAQWAMGMFEGHGNPFEVGDLPDDTLDQVWDSLNDDEQTKIAVHMRDTLAEKVPDILKVDENGDVYYHGDEEGEAFRPSYYSDIRQLLDETGDPEDYSSRFASAAWRGAETGAENEMAKDFTKYLDNMVPLEAEYEYGDNVDVELHRPNQDWDKPVYLIGKEEDIVNLASETELEKERLESWSSVYRWPSFSEPSFGWYGFDEESASDSVREDFYELFKS
jgi:hypothetical protein